MKTLIQNKLLFPELIWERPVHFYKNEGGKVLIVAGARSNPQRAILACESVFRSGTGVLTLAYPESLGEIYKDFLPDTMKLPLPETFGGSLGHESKKGILEHSKVCNIALIGPGLSNNAETIQLLWELCFEINIPVLIVDDAVKALIKGIEVLRQNESEEFLVNYFIKASKISLLLTKEELVKLLNACNFKEHRKLANINSDQKIIEFLNFLNQTLNIDILIRGNGGILCTKDGVIVNKIGACDSPVLEGITASFLAQNPEKRFEAMAVSLYLHGHAENIAKQKIGDRELVSSDILRYLPEAIKASENH